METLETISAALECTDAKKEDLKKAFDELQSHSSVLASFSRSDLDAHFTTLQNSLTERFHLLESLELEKQTQTHYSVTPPRIELRAFCESIDGKGLRKYVLEHPNEKVAIIAELPGAMRCTPDPAAMVLDAMEGFYSVKGNKERDVGRLRRSCVPLLEALMGLKPNVGVGVRERAKVGFGEDSVREIESMTNEEIVQDAFESFEIDDDVVEVNSLGDDSVSMGIKKKGKKCRKTSDVWQYYDIVPNANPNDPELEKAGSLGVSDSKFDPKRYRELLVASVIKHDLLFSYVKYDGVRAVHQYLSANVPFISRNAGKTDLVKMYLREKQRVKSMLNACPRRICLTSDLWTSLATDGYICLTAHFINKDWVLTKRMLNFSFMPPAHNGISLSDVIYNLLQEWGIENKIFSITLDNASFNDLCVGFLKDKLNMKKALPCDRDFFHMHCCAHILNLIVQDGLKEINDAIQKIQDSVKYVRGSQVRKQSFLQAVNQISLDSHKGLKQDVPTRWNSTYLMLESVVHYRRAFSYLEMNDKNYKHYPTALEWEKVNNIKSFLAYFYQATCAFSGTKYSTANLYFPVIAMIYVSLKEDVLSEDEHKSLIATQMLFKFEKYWLEFSEVLAVAVILDPRYKLHLVNYYYTKIYRVMNSTQYMNVHDKLKNLFMEYSASSIPSNSSSITVHQPQEYLAFGGVDVNSQKSQLEIYLEEPSIGGRVIDQYRSSLKPNIVEALIYSRDWLYGDQAQMKLDSIEEEILTTDVNSCDIPNSSGAQSANIS
ncbi:zinc finger BED domain-containing protein RICESLEEPER 2-like [Corylus avellana]|uniref:zinc finger BED domain-containing protein RICESLEEPER 2-like n=1 Tax=Corylus avellana TaxID=13451 RepID=UPI00286A829F|nr:zinc finger BED domain-containing protein RICESLEEPER 2-like [Corylus avellana]